MENGKEQKGRIEASAKIRSFMVPWGIVSITALFIGIILIVVIIAKIGGRYRVVKVEDFGGSVNIEREGADIDVFPGLQLVSEDIVSTGDKSWLGMIIDSDKHIGADANTTFKVTASGSDRKGTVTIDLVSGSALFTIEQKLNEDSTFEVTTPNATLSVRGTTFSVSYNPATNTTSTTVSEGIVWAEYGDGQMVELHAGDGGLITDDEFTDREKPIFIVTRIYPMSDDPSEGPDSVRFAYTIRGGENKSVWSVSDEAVTDGDETLARTAADISNGYLMAHEDEIAAYITVYRSERINQPVSDIPGGDSASGWYLDTFNYGSEDEMDITDWFPEELPMEFEDGSGYFRISKAVMWTQVFDENISDGVIKDAYIKELGIGFYGSREYRMREEVKKQGRLIHIIVIFAAIAISSMLFLTNAFRELESMTEDRLYQQGEPVPGDIKIIAIDEETLTKLGPYTDWSRAYFASLMERLDSSEKPASVIGFDIIFSGDGVQEDDTALADAVKASPCPVVLASKLDFASKIESDGTSGYYYDYYVKDEAAAYDGLQQYAEKGFTNALLDTDGYVRRAYLRVSSGSSVYPSFVSKILELSGTDTSVFPDTVTFRYSGRPNEFEAVPMHKVIDGSIPADYFADSIVIIGAYDEGLLDSYSVPIDHGTLMYGAETHANVINAVRNGYIIRQAPVWIEFLMLFVILILFGVVCSRCRMGTALISLAGIIAGYYLLVYVLYRFSSVMLRLLYIPVGAAMLFLSMLLVKYVEIQKKRAQEMKKTLFSMADSMAQAIEGRTPYNANHTRNVAKRSVEMLHYINRLHKEKKTKLHFTEKETDQMYLAAMLHDIGKMDVPLEVMDKPTKLGNTEQRLRDRLAIIKLNIKIMILTSKISEEKGNARIKKIDDFLADLGLYNCGKPLSPEEFAAIDEMASYVYTDDKGQELHYLTEEEVEDLHIKAGTLSDGERTIMQSHVVYTDKILSHVYFSEDFSNVREIASNHHELLNGAGYPNHLTGERLDTMTRILTIMDIYDSLIADDRPYKKPKSVEVAFEILDEEAEAGKVDPELLAIAKDMYLNR